MSNLSQFAGGSIKSIQRGTISLASGGSTTGTATISSVDTTKTELRILGYTLNAEVMVNTPRIALTNATTITATRAGTTCDTVVSWEATERY